MCFKTNARNRHCEKREISAEMEISAEKTKLMTNNTSGINKEIKLNWQKLETVTSFKCLDSVVSDEGLKSETLARISQTTAALTRLKPVWNDRSVSLSSKMRLMRSLVNIHLPVCSWIMDPHSRAAKKNTSHGNEVLPQDTMDLIHRPRYQRAMKSVPRFSRQLDHTKTS